MKMLKRIMEIDAAAADSIRGGKHVTAPVTVPAP